MHEHITFTGSIAFLQRLIFPTPNGDKDYTPVGHTEHTMLNYHLISTESIVFTL